MTRRLPTSCPDVCPTCGCNLKREGRPYRHQHADTGAQCAWGWEPPGPLDPGYEPD